MIHVSLSRVMRAPERKPIFHVRLECILSQFATPARVGQSGDGITNKICWFRRNMQWSTIEPTYIPLEYSFRLVAKEQASLCITAACQKPFYMYIQCERKVLTYESESNFEHLILKNRLID